MRRTFPALALTIVACAGGDDGEDSGVDDRTPMTCEVVANPENCWAVAADEAYACIPEADATGTFDANREVCTLGNGITITFDQPVPVDPFADEADDYLWSFTVDSGGAQCARLDETLSGYVLTTDSGTADAHSSGLFGYELECPDGEVFYTADFFDLFECEGDTYIPGYSYSGNVSFGLLGTTSERFNWWQCE